MLCSVENFIITDLNSSEKVDKIVGLHCIIYCVDNAVAVMYSRNIPMAETRIVCFQRKYVCYFYF